MKPEKAELLLDLLQSLQHKHGAAVRWMKQGDKPSSIALAEADMLATRLSNRFAREFTGRDMEELYRKVSA